MVNLRVKFSTRLFYWLPVAFFLCGSTAEAIPSQNVILGQYVVDPSKLSKSLLFDQVFDHEVVRPLQRPLAEPKTEVVKAEPPTARGSLELASIETPKKDPSLKIADEATFDFSKLWEIPKIVAEIETPRPSALVSKASAPSSLLVDAVRGDLGVQGPEKISNVNSPTLAVTAVPAVNAVKTVTQNTVTQNKEPTETKAPDVSIDLPKNLYRRGPIELLLIDEESFLENKPRVVQSANVFWGHPSLLLSTRPNASGRVAPPNKNFSSSRFIVQADGYLPAVGYASGDMITPVILVKEKRLPPVLKTLGVNPTAGRAIVWGKLLTSNLEAKEHVKVDSSDPESKTYYSTGSFGLFHPKVTRTGTQGDFLIAGLGRQLHYLLPTEDVSLGEVHEMAPALMNLDGLGTVVTTTLVEGRTAKMDTQVVDGLSLEKPETSVFATVGGMRGMETADVEGFMRFPDLALRNQVDLVEVRASGYMKTWLNAPATRGAFPELVSLFSRSQLNELLEGSGVSLRQNDPVVLGQLRPEIYRRNYTLELFDSNGASPQDYRVVYFDVKNHPTPNQNFTDRTMQTFAILQVPTGEFHLMVRDSETKELISMQVIRAADGVITQVQF